MQIDNVENGLYSKIIFCLMAKLGVTEIKLTNQDMKNLANNEDKVDVRYQLDTVNDFVVVSYAFVKE